MHAYATIQPASKLSRTSTENYMSRPTLWQNKNYDLIHLYVCFCPRQPGVVEAMRGTIKRIFYQ